MLGAMHVLDLAAGDAVLVPAGLPHAIGQGALVVELQEPTDLSILLEWSGFQIDGAADGHLGLGFDVALAAVDRRGWSADEIARLRGATAASSGDLLPDAAAFFRVERWTGPRVLDAGLAVLVVVDGAGTLVADGGPRRCVAGTRCSCPPLPGRSRSRGTTSRSSSAARPVRRSRLGMRVHPNGRTMDGTVEKQGRRREGRRSPRDGTRCSTHDTHG